MSEVKILANYLPQFHSIPENDKWWGKGFTDWVSVKKATSLYKGHQQPKIPLNNHYYSLDDINEIKWQINLAKKYDIYGFAIYHYWFNSDMALLTKPAELILENQELDIPFLFLWDNCTWKRTWSNLKHANDWAPDMEKQVDKKAQEGDGILARLDYGNEKDWKLHFDYLLPFFQDSRYIKIDNKPVFGFFQPNIELSTIKRMVSYWNELAKSYGFNGIYCMSRDNYLNFNLKHKFRYTPLVPNNKLTYVKYKVKDIIAKKNNSIRFYDYDKIWRQIIREAKNSDHDTFLSGFVSFDDTPRRGMNGRVIRGCTPDKFENYLETLIKISKEQNKEFVFVTAWNEWGEGAYLEPDSVNKYEFLQSLKKAIENGNK